MTSILVTGAGGPLGANVTRSLRAAGQSLRLVGTDANRWHLPLSLCDRTYLIPRASDADGYATALAKVIERERIDVVLPTHPVEVRAVAALRDRDRLAGAKTALPSLPVIESADDKGATHSTLARAGVPVPATIALDGEADLVRAFATLGAPVWVRGSGAPGLGLGGAALPCEQLAVAQSWVEHHRGWGRMLASEFLPGANLTWMALFDAGRLVAAGARERLEYVLPHVSPSGITGAPAVSRTIERAELTDIGSRAVRALDSQPHGAYFVDLKEDSAGHPRVTEINAGRCGTTVHFYTEAGCNFPWLLAQIALGRAPRETASPEVDLYWVRTLDCGPVLVRGDAGFDAYGAAP